MSGLYQRALTLFNQAEITPQKTAEGPEIKKDGAIPEAEQKEIISQIENLVSKDKTAITDEILTLKAQKNGIFFPTIINIGALVVVFASFFVFQSISLSRENMIYLNSQSSSGRLDSKVIESMKKDSQEKLNAKEKEISNIQNQLKSLDDEKNNLQSNIEKTVSAKKAELEKLMQEELTKKQKELENQGISTQDIEKTIADYRKTKELEFNKTFDDYKSKAEAQRIEDEKKLSALQDNFSKNLSSLTTEKQTLETDIKSKQTQIEELTKKTDEEKKALTTEKKTAEAKLKEISDLRDREQLVNNQIVGLYTKIMASMKAGNYSQAQRSIEDMRNYFQDPAIVALPGITKRRDTELFIIDSLTNLIQSEQSKKDFDASGILQKAGLITSISRKVEDADALYKSADFDGAQRLYEEALAIIPEIRKSYTQTDEINLAKINAEFSSLKSTADTFYFNRNYSSAVDGYTRALKLIPGDQAKVDDAISRLLDSGSRLAGKTIVNPDDEKAAALIVAKANTGAGQGKYPEAIDSYLEILRLYPRTTYVSIAAAGVSDSLSKERAALIAKNETAIGAKNSLITEKDTAIAQLNTIIEKDKISLKEKDDKIASLSAIIDKTNPGPGFGDNDVTQLRADIEKYKSQLKEKDDKIAKLTSDFSNGKTTGTDKDIIVKQLTAENDKYKSLIKEKDDTIARLEATIVKGKPTTTDTNGRIAQLSAEVDKYKALLKEKDTTIEQLNATIAKNKAVSDVTNEELTKLKLIETDLNAKVLKLEKDKSDLSNELALFKKKSPAANTTPGPEKDSIVETSAPPETTKIPSIPDTVLSEYNALKAKIDELKHLYINYSQAEDKIIKEKGPIGYLSSKPMLGEMLNSQVARELFPDLYERIKKYDAALSADERAYGREKGIEEITDIINNRLTLSKDKKPEDYWKGIFQTHKDDDVFLDLINLLRDMMEK